MKRAISYYLSHAVQYFSPLLKEMAKEFDLTVYYLSEASIKGTMDKGFGQVVKWDTPLLDGYHYRYIKNFSWRKSLTNRFADLINPGVFRGLIRDKSPIIIVNGWAYLSVVWIIMFAGLVGKKVWLRAENPLNQELRKNKGIILIKRIVLQYFLFRFVDRFLYIGSESKRFFLYYGVDEGKMVFTPYAVDNDYFQLKHKELQPRRGELKRAFSIPVDNKVILFVGKYIQKKRPLDLLKAFEKLGSPSTTLLMVGEGELRSEMEAFCHQRKLDNVILTGFVNQSRIPEYYSVSDVYVMCSGMGETWGLSVNEAMNFELPIVVTDTCGCSSDLVVEGRNGFVVPEGNINCLANSLQTLLEDVSFKTQAPIESSILLEVFSISNIIHNIQHSIDIE